MKTACLLYAVADFTGMLWTGYHPPLLIVSFWFALLLFYSLASHAQRKRARKHREALWRSWQEVRE